MEVIKAIKFKYNGDLNELFEDFKEMIEFCINRALELGMTSYAKLRKAIYDEWKRRWYPKYHTHYCHSACKIATAILKNFRKRKRKGQTNKDKPEVKRDFIKLEKMLFRFEGERIRIVTAPRKFVTIELVVGEYQHEFIEAWKRGEYDIGEIIIKRDCIIVPFKKEVEPKELKAIMTIDVNEKNVTYTVFDRNGNIIKSVRLDIYKVKRIHENYSRKRQKIQEKLAKKPKKLKEVMHKYSGRERRKIEDYLHKVSVFIVREATRYNAEIIMEDLKNIRDSINRKRKNLRRRLNRWNFRKLQFFIEYKAKWNGLNVKYIEPNGSSSLCPICGYRLNPKGRRILKCNRCNLEFDRDVVATLNLFKSGCGEPRSPRTLPDEVWLIKPDGTGELLKVDEYYEKLLKPP